MVPTILLVVTILFIGFKAFVYKTSLLAILQYYVDRVESIPEKVEIQEYQMKVMKKWLSIKED